MKWKKDANKSQVCNLLPSGEALFSEACAASIHHASLTCPFISTTLGQQNTTLSFTKISSHLGWNVAKYVLERRSRFKKSGCLNGDQDWDWDYDSDLGLIQFDSFKFDSIRFDSIIFIWKTGGQLREKKRGGVLEAIWVMILLSFCWLKLRAHFRSQLLELTSSWPFNCELTASARKSHLLLLLLLLLSTIAPKRPTFSQSRAAPEERLDHFIFKRPIFFWKKQPRIFSLEWWSTNKNTSLESATQSLPNQATLLRYKTWPIFCASLRFIFSSKYSSSIETTLVQQPWKWNHFSWIILYLNLPSYQKLKSISINVRSLVFDCNLSDWQIFTSLKLKWSLQLVNFVPG